MFIHDLSLNDLANFFTAEAMMITISTQLQLTQTTNHRALAMIRTSLLLLLAISLFACSSSGSKTPFKGSANSSQANEIDTSQPASFEVYKEWRQKNDPDGELYAEYIEWEAAYKQWLKKQPNFIQ